MLSPKGVCMKKAAERVPSTVLESFVLPAFASLASVEIKDSVKDIG